MIKLINTADHLKGNKIYINKDHIVAVFEVPVEEGGSLQTVVLGGPQGTNWTVEEGLGTVASLVNKG